MVIYFYTLTFLFDLSSEYLSFHRSRVFSGHCKAVPVPDYFMSLETSFLVTV